MDLESPKPPKCYWLWFYPPALHIETAPTLKHRSPSFNPSDLSFHHVCHSPPRPFFSSFSLSPLPPHFPSSRPLPLCRGLSSFLLLLSASLPPLSNPPPLYLGCLYSHLAILLSQSRRGESTLKMKFVGPLVKFDGWSLNNWSKSKW